MNFIAPIWLWAIAAIIIPVIIHLWNIREGKTLKVGSIAFLTETTRSHARSLKLSEWLLLLLRCLLLIALAMLTAKPFMEKYADFNKEKGWYLIEKGSVKEVYSHFRPTIDSLTAAGYTFHYFDTTLREGKIKDILEKEDTGTESTLSYWNLLSVLNNKVSSNLPVCLFTTNAINRFEGLRPTVSLNLTWKMYEEADSSARWLQEAYITTHDSVRIITGNSNRSGTYFTSQDVLRGNVTAGLSFKTIDGKVFLVRNNTFAHNDGDKVEVDTAVLNISIYTGRYFSNGNYLAAALRAIRDFTGKRISVKVAAGIGDIGTQYDWLFWLSEETIPASLVKNNVLVYKKGKIKKVFTRMVHGEAASTGDEAATVYKLVENNNVTNNHSGNVKWADGYGNAILSATGKQEDFYLFYSRFNPSWNDLVWSSGFAESIYTLIYSDKNYYDKSALKDKRVIDEQQAAVVRSAVKNSARQKSFLEKTDLTSILWVIAFALLLLERLVSYRPKKVRVYA